jgi:hypothetical protein
MVLHWKMEIEWTTIRLTLKWAGFIYVLIDSGAATNVIDSDTWKYLKKQRIKCVSEPTAKRLSIRPVTTAKCDWQISCYRRD